MNTLPFITVTTLTGRELQLGYVSGFSYKYSEEEDDVAEIEIESNNSTIADHVDFQEGNSLKITWGYIDATRSEKVTRIVYIFDTKSDYTTDGIKLTLTCHEKFAAAKMDVALPQNSSGSTSSANTLIVQTKVLDNIKVNEGYTEKFLGLFNEATKLNSREREIIQEGINDPNYVINYTRIGDQGPYNPRILRDAGGLNISLYNGNLPTFRGLKEYFTKLPGGPYVIDSRDDQVIIKPRDFNQSPILDYAYNAEPGGLLSFTPETKNRTKSSASEKQEVTGWNSEDKEPIVGVSLNTSTGQTQKNLWQKLQQETPLPGTEEWLKGQNTKGNKTAKPSTKKNPRATTIRQIGMEPVRSPFATINEAMQDSLKNYILGPEPTTTKTESQGKSLVVGNESEENIDALAENLREEAQLENNPASAEVIGNVKITSGRIINIQGVSIKHQGQYYIKECTHTIDDNGYMVSIDKMVRPGVKENKAKVKSQGTQEPVKSLTVEDPAKIVNPMDRFNQYHQYPGLPGINPSQPLPREEINRRTDDRLIELGLIKPDQS